MEAKPKSRPFKKLYCDWRTRIFSELTSAELKVWLYHYLRSGKDDSSHPKLYTISKDTHLHQNTVKAARKGLRTKGWLISKPVRGAKGTFAVPEETAVIPPQNKNCAAVSVPKSTVAQKHDSHERRLPSNCATGVDSGFKVDTVNGVGNKNASVESTGDLATHTPSEKATSPQPSAPVTGRANLPDGWLPLPAMIQAVFEETGQRVFFPKRYHAVLKRLAAKYGEDELVNAVRESCSQSFGPTFKWRLFAAWLLNPDYGRGGILATIVAARELRRQREPKELAASV